MLLSRNFLVPIKIAALLPMLRCILLLRLGTVTNHLIWLDLCQSNYSFELFYQSCSFPSVILSPEYLVEFTEIRGKNQREIENHIKNHHYHHWIAHIVFGALIRSVVGENLEVVKQSYNEEFVDHLGIKHRFKSESKQPAVQQLNYVPTVKHRHKLKKWPRCKYDHGRCLYQSTHRWVAGLKKGMSAFFVPKVKVEVTESISVLHILQFGLVF